MPAFRMKRLPARYAAVITPLILSVFMSAIVSFIATWRAVGLPDGVAWLWLSAWKTSWLVAFPSLLVVLPIVRRITALLVEPAGPQH